MCRSFDPGIRISKLLFGRASRCAHPGCVEPLISEHRGALSVNAQIAHIRSGSPTGPRHDPTFAPALLDAEPNLLLLCLKHHKWVDDHPGLYGVEELLQWKERQVKRGLGIPGRSRALAHYSNPDRDPRGPWLRLDASAPVDRPELRYTIASPDGTEVVPPTGRSWAFLEERMRELAADRRLVWSSTGRPYVKRFLSEAM